MPEGNRLDLLQLGPTSSISNFKSLENLIFTMIKDLDIVTLTHNIEEHGLSEGSHGTVVHCYKGGQGFEVEFLDPPHVLTLDRSDIKLDGALIQIEVAELLSSLPEEGLAEIRDFATSLRQKYLRKVS